MKTIIIYDNNVRKGEFISDIIGNKGFGDIVIKKVKVEDRFYNCCNTLFKNAVYKKINSQIEYMELLNQMKQYLDDDVKILHCFSNFYIANKESVLLSLKKIFYVDEPYKLCFNQKIAALMFSDVKTYLQYCKNIISAENIVEAAGFIKNYSEIDGFIDLSQINNFISCITGGLDARYFNSLKEDKYTITKSSSDKLKIKKEYTYYHLLPDDMKLWFVMPYNYKEEENTASYTMERLHMTDLAIKWVHGSIEKEEFSLLLDKYFYFFASRHETPCTKEEYDKISKELYVDKVIERINTLKHLDDYEKLEKFLNSAGFSLDELVQKYLSLKERIETKNNYKTVNVIGHGDPGFANALYNRATQTLKFIDPKGALKEEDLWTNPYYDVAKLSHCICGRYDFFNNALFDIKLNDNFSFDLDIPFDNKKYIEIFKDKLQEHGFDYKTVRIYEASLFLSMLPLHFDNPYKVFGFILNAKNILEEIEQDV